MSEMYSYLDAECKYVFTQPLHYTLDVTQS